MVSPGAVESPLQSDHQPRTHSSLGRQFSIYSLTLDEFQHTLCESGKNFSSMNMDEFLASIWNAEENQQAAAATNTNGTAQFYGKGGSQALNDASGEHRSISKQPSLPRQGSLTLPAPLCRKTVDEVWSQIQKGQHQQQQQNNGGKSVQNPDSAPRQQPTFGEMTLEDFLVKAGVVREQCSVTAPLQQQRYGMYPSRNGTSALVAGDFVSRPIPGMPTGSSVSAVSYQTMPPAAGNIGESSVRNGGYPPPSSRPPPIAVYRARVRNGAGYGPGQAIGVVGPVSTVSSDRMVATIDNVANQHGNNIGGLRGRQRIIDGPVEKVVERRQRRMIKNRESAARSRARKQAYIVELEAELNQVKEDNKQLKHALAEIERKRREQAMGSPSSKYNEELSMKAQTKVLNAKERFGVMRRNLSCPL